MTKKRFILIDGVKKGTHSGIWDNQKQNNQRVGDELWVGEVVAMLNEGIAIVKENEQLKASLYAEKTNTAEVINEYAKQFKRHSSQFSFMIDLAEDLGIDVSKLEALDD